MMLGRPPVARADAGVWLVFYFMTNPGPQRAGAIQSAARDEGISRNTLRRAAAELGIVREPAGGGPTCRWSLPD